MIKKGQRANIFLPKKKCPSKRKRRHTGGQKPAPRPFWSPLGDLPTPIQTSYFIGPYNLHYLLFSGIGALLCHHPYCFPSQSQTLFGLGAGRPPLGQYCSDKHPRDFYRSSPLVISVSRTF